MRMICWLTVWVCVFTGRAPAAEDSTGKQMPALPVKVEMVCSNVSANTIHGWQSCRLVKFEGRLYATAGVIRPNEAPGDMMGSDTSSLVFRREPDGTWPQVAIVKDRSYTWCVAPDGTFWIVGPTSYEDTKTIRTRIPKDFNSLEQVYNQNANSYLGAGVNTEGDFLLLHAKDAKMEAFVPNAVIAAFYDCASKEWHRSRLETPEGRYGYEGILLHGKTALAVLNSAIRDKDANPVPPHYSWRHVRLARCDDLTKGRWVNKPWLMPKYGDTALQDFMRGPDGLAYLAYAYRSGTNSYEETAKAPMLHYIARIHDDLQADVFPTGIRAGSTRLLVDSAKAWYIVGRLASGQNLHLWKVDDKAGFKPVKEYELPGTDTFDGYVIHTLRPERFGGESDGDTVHLMTTKHIYANDQKTIDHAELWHAYFDLASAR
jgi:hypothetical protein